MLDTLIQPTEEMGRKIALADIASPIVRAGYDYWRAKKGANPYPSRADVNPAEIKKLLPNVILVRALAEHDYEFRIVGEANVRAHGFNCLNWRVADMDSQVRGYTAMLLGLYAHIRQTGRPLAARGSLVHIDRSYQDYESIYMPLGPVGGPVDHLIAVADYFEEVY